MTEPPTERRRGGDYGTNYAEDKVACHDFLEATYASRLDAILERDEEEGKVLPIDLDKLSDFSKSDVSLVPRIVKNARRYVQLFEEVADDILKETMKSRPPANFSKKRDVLDVLQEQRQNQVEEAARADDDPQTADQELAFPAALMRRYEVRLKAPSTVLAAPLREIRAADIGSLVVTKGIITRTSEVKPLVEVATYTCDCCGFEIYQEVGFKKQFLPLQNCPGPQCQKNKIAGRLFLQTRGSKFVKYQELRLQELPDQVPIGHIPRSITVQCRGELTRGCAPGDMVTLSGIFLPCRYSGFRALRAGLIADTYIEAMDVVKHKLSYDEFELDDEMNSRIDEVAEEPDAYSRLARSIAPEIFGHEDVKKALLLQLVCGVSRALPDGMKIRGDINICLMGDPGVAKSQLLKYISTLAPRGVYTTGKGSSGVGLTAAVVRDPVTGETSLEGGALVLADCGICCIDEFDKMDDFDRVAIHEVMEQQTVSIAKAGITTTLNARCAVLAAANPLFGRYNRSRSMGENINLPNSLLSRFDLLFLLLDKANLEGDAALARHVTYVHRYLKNPELEFTPLDITLIKNYVAQARLLEPYVPEEISGYIVESYVQLRMEQNDVSDQTNMTARQLLSILRLTQALARLRFSEFVSKEDVDEALRLTHMSKASLMDDDYQAARDRLDPTSRIYSIIRDYADLHQVTCIDYQRAENMVLRRGFQKEQLERTLEEYSALNVLQLDAARTRISFC